MLVGKRSINMLRVLDLFSFKQVLIRKNIDLLANQKDKNQKQKSARAQLLGVCPAHGNTVGSIRGWGSHGRQFSLPLPLSTISKRILR